MPDLELFIFDVDGVLRDSAPAGLEGMLRGLKAIGVPTSYTKREYRLMRSLGKYNNSQQCLTLMYALQRAGTTIEKLVATEAPEAACDALLERYVTEADYEKMKDARNVYKEFFYSQAAGQFVRVLPGIPEVLDELKNRYTLAIWSNAASSTLDRDLGPYLDRFSYLLGGEDMNIKKPSPDGILKICDDLSIERAKTAYVGDAAVDVQAAKAAGVVSIVTLSEVPDREILKREGADFYFEDIREMAKQFVH
ncbi:MAG: HAD family hydrolase [Nanoarchaeota archaeon]|nr:HAD family hydrolase [Nanoarchaeota archaeon]